MIPNFGDPPVLSSPALVLHGASTCEGSNWSDWEELGGDGDGLGLMGRKLNKLESTGKDWEQRLENFMAKWEG